MARRVTVGVLIAANTGLMLSVAGNLTSLSDVLAPLMGHFIGIGLAASLALLARRRMMATLAVGFAATLAVHAILGLAQCCRAPTEKGGTATLTTASQETGRGLTVLTLNTWHGNDDAGRIEQYLLSVPADIIVLSEFGPTKQALLTRLRDVYPFQVECAGEWPCSLVMLSRVPLESAGASRIAADKPAFLWARLAEAQHGALTIIGTHLRRPSLNPWEHEKQMAELAQFIRRIDGPLVLAGDLNTSPWSQAFRSLRMATGLQPAGLLTPSWPAWPVAIPQVALDHILVSQELSVSSAGTGPAVGSDHLPVWAHIRRRPLAVYRNRPRTGSRLAAAAPHLGSQLLADFRSEHGGARNLRR
ncbi:MAG: endonuclease/exonuclease/phosphatase family protein [Hyphomicrobiaceae bacterium]|nr:MAG: endonuclease/exonuclease/phosphatase family protein [Hyphomicrobiaceae bacterium]